MNRSFDPYALLRPLIFRMNPELAHRTAFALGGFAQRIPGALGIARSLCGQPEPTLAREVFGLRFPSPVGLAAGLDKGAELLPLWKALGFGFVEIGTVTPGPRRETPSRGSSGSRRRTSSSTAWASTPKDPRWWPAGCGTGPRG